MLSPFHYAFVQRGVFEVLLLSVAAGLLGSWIVLRGLSFFTHAVGTATFPGLVLADGLGFAAVLGGAASALVFAAGVERASRRRALGYDSLTALALAGTLALGVVLASDVFHSGSNVETLLFGSLLLIGDRELVLAAAAAAAALALTVLLGRRWLAIGFDPEHARALGLRSPLPDAVLLVLVALSATVSVSAIGALLVTALFIVPAATVRVLTSRLIVLQLGSVVLAAAEGVAGIWLSVEWNVPPGAAIAVLAGACFAAAVAVRALPALAVATLALLIATGCTGQRSVHGLSVVATTTQIGDWARAVGGARVDVHQILRPNTDPHDYEPRPADVEAASDAGAVFENGDGLDGWMTKVVDLANGRPRVVVLGDHIPVVRDDPHWWHDPRNAIAAVRQVRDTLSRLDPGSAGAFDARASAYVRRLRRLDRGIASCIETIPPSDRKLVTDHDAFGYFAARYGLRVVGAVIPSQTTQAEPSARDVVRLIALIKREHVKAIFPESSLSPRLARQIARETGATADHSLYGDSLGPKGSSGATYLAMEAANADAITRGLTGGRRCTIR